MATHTHTHFSRSHTLPPAIFTGFKSTPPNCVSGIHQQLVCVTSGARILERPPGEREKSVVCFVVSIKEFNVKIFVFLAAAAAVRRLL